MTNLTSSHARPDGFPGGAGPVRTFFAPGRINLIGEHLDYNGGRVLPAAVTQGITGYARERDDRLVRLKSEQFPGEATADLDGEISRDPALGWANYPLGAIRYVRESGRAIPSGLDILYSSTLPVGAGLSSSAAIEILTAVIVAGVPGPSEGGLTGLALLMRDMENEFIGVRCGMMDQFAVALGKKGSAILLDSETMEYEYVPVDLSGSSLVIMNTNSPRSLADSKYNDRRAECEEALGTIRSKRRNVTCLARARMGDLDLVPDGPLRRRARHVISENARVTEAAEALRTGDIARFGRLLGESHRSLQDDYEVTGPELDALVDAATRSPGCAGARMTGAGFGGCAIALVRGRDLDAFREETGARYRRATGLVADFYESAIEDGVRELS
ncbi:MAG: galactokinase [Spirochaetes bacterium]|nr:galactokinase [Spirochaetota bacterium]